MAELIVFTAGFAGGWFFHQYREKLFRLKQKVEKAVNEEFKS